MSYITYFKKHIALILLVTLLAGAGGVVFSLFQTGKYEAQARVLIVQTYNGNLDAYSASKSAESISSLLSQIVYTNSFLTQVVNANYYIENNFGKTDEARSKEWRKTISVDTVKDTGILEIHVYHRDKHQAEQIAHAISYLLVSQGTTYYGNDNLFKVKIIDQPSVSEKTVLPNIPQNGVFAAIFAFSGVIMFLILRYESGVKTIISVPYATELATIWAKHSNEKFALQTKEDEELSERIATQLRANLAKLDNK